MQPAGSVHYELPSVRPGWELSEDTMPESVLLRRTYAGDGPVRSPYLGAYLVPVDEGRRLRIAADAEGTEFWLTAEEAHREARDAERAAKEAAVARIAELEALLASKPPGGSSTPGR